MYCSEIMARNTLQGHESRDHYDGGRDSVIDQG